MVCEFSSRWASRLAYDDDVLWCAVKHTGNLTMDMIMDVAGKMRFKSMARTMKGTVLVSLGCVVSRARDGGPRVDVVCSCQKTGRALHVCLCLCVGG
jgi:hypothetical protein